MMDSCVWERSSAVTASGRKSGDRDLKKLVGQEPNIGSRRTTQKTLSPNQVETRFIF